MRTLTSLTVCFVLLASVGCASGEANAPNESGTAIAVPPPPSSDQRARLVATAREDAWRDGEPSPRNVVIGQGTRREVSRVLWGEQIAYDASVYLVGMEGDFVWSGPRPPGQSSPTGKYLLVVIDARTGKPLDISISPVPVDLSRFDPQAQHS
jgi:hypothetical protein